MQEKQSEKRGKRGKIEYKVTSVLIGASRKEQITDNVKIVDHPDFTEDELTAIKDILKEL